MRTEQQIFIISNLVKVLLGQPAIEVLRHVTIHPSLRTIKSMVNMQSLNPKKEMPDANFGIFGENNIRLCVDSRPYSILTPCPENSREEIVIISKVEEPTKWYSTMLEVLKAKAGAYYPSPLTTKGGRSLIEGPGQCF